MELPVEVDAKKRLRVKVPRDASPVMLDRFAEELRTCVTAEGLPVALDCGELEQVSSCHINILWLAHQICQDTGAELWLSRVSPGMRRVLSVLDLAGLFRYEEAAVSTEIPADLPADTANVFTDRFPSDREGVNRALDRFLDFLSRISAPQVDAYELRIVFYEVVTNIQNHAHVEKTELITFTATTTPKQVVMNFTDCGVEFDVTTFSYDLDFVGAAKERRKRGLGIAMINRLSDCISYTRTEDGVNVLTIEKNWSHKR